MKERLLLAISMCIFVICIHADLINDKSDLLIIMTDQQRYGALGSVVKYPFFRLKNLIDWQKIVFFYSCLYTMCSISPGACFPKTCYYVRGIMKRFYVDKPDGLVNNDDSGLISARHILARCFLSI